MSRPLRLAFEDACYHITSRGNRRDNIFLSDNDKEVFIEKLNETLNKYSIICYAYCLMDNHYHLFIKTPKGNISEGMHHLNTSYTNWFKAQHKILGVIFQGRYKSILVDEDNYAVHLTAYIHLNPVRAEVVKKPEQYIWSSHLEYLGKKKSLDNMDIDFVLNQFNRDNKKAREQYVSFVRDNKDMENPAIKTYKSIAIGNEKYLKKIEEMVRNIGRKREIKETKNIGNYSSDNIINVIAKRFNLNDDEVINKKRDNIYRKLAMYIVRKYTELSLNEIGKIFFMDYSAVSQACKRFEENTNKDKKLYRMKESVVRDLQMSNVET
ncbi:MAG: helix-turn-helix domain-containing protein [Thermodesulfobacteriota bacterium]